MSKFISRGLLFLFLFIIIQVFIYLSIPKGLIGNHYARFASPKAYSLITGSSMAAQDLEPSIIDSAFHSLYKGPIYNYSFAINSSPYGPAYLKSIKKKLMANADTSSLFIIGVDPFSIGGILGDEEHGHKREAHSVIGKMHTVNARINIEHLLRYEITDKNYYRRHYGSYINEGGRFISTISMDEDSINVIHRIEEVILPDYRNNYVPGYYVSNERVSNLEKLIHLFKQNGHVFLIRLPTGPEVTTICDSICPQFDRIISTLSTDNDVHYINFKNQNIIYRTTDGVHLYKDEGDRFTRVVCDSIKTFFNDFNCNSALQ